MHPDIPQTLLQDRDPLSDSPAGVEPPQPRIPSRTAAVSASGSYTEKQIASPHASGATYTPTLGVTLYPFHWVGGSGKTTTAQKEVQHVSGDGLNSDLQ